MDLFMQRASSFAGDIDRLVWLVTFLTGFWFLLAEGMFFFWYVANEAVDPPVLIGYDAAGNVVAERAQPNLTTSVPTRTGG